MFGANTSTSKRPSAPLASHPAFPWIVIAWTTLLFGACMFLVVSAWSSSVILPLGMALVAAILGAVCGYRLCRSVGARLPATSTPFASRSGGGADEYEEEKAPVRRRTRSFGAASIMSTDDLGSESLDAPLEMTDGDTVEETSLYGALDVTDAAIADDTASVAVFADDADAQPLPTYYEDPFAEDSFDEAPSPNDRHRRNALGRHKFMADEPLPLDAFAMDMDDEEEVREPATPIDFDKLTPKCRAQSSGEEEAPLVLQPPVGVPPVFQKSGPQPGAGGDPKAFAESAKETETPSEADAPLMVKSREAEIIDLKQRDLKDLSLVQMVERFAVGLEDHRVARATDPASRRVRPSDPRIAQAIRDLPIGELKPSGDSKSARTGTRAEAEQTEAALREALEKLQRMSDHG